MTDLLLSLQKAFGGLSYQDEIQKYLDNLQGTFPQDSPFFTICEAYEKTRTEALENLSKLWEKNIQKAEKEDILGTLHVKSGITVFGENWDKLIHGSWRGLEDYKKKNILKTISTTHLYLILKNGTPTSETVDLVHQQITSGTFPLITLEQETTINFADGCQLALGFDNWTPKLKMPKNTGFVFPDKGTDGIMFQQSVSFPSGRILISDQIRIENFTDILLNTYRKLGLKINYQWHSVMRTQIAAKVRNVVDVSVGSDGPNIIVNNNVLMAAFLDKEGLFKTLAPVCHDYWGTNIVDEEILYETLMETGLSREDIKESIDAWIESTNTNRVTVSPGIWHLIWDEDRVTLDTYLKNASIPKGEKVFFMLTQTPLPPDTPKLLTLS
jgi:hypothetical protein